MTAALGATTEFVAIPYGPSGVAPSSSVREFELYFEELEAAGFGDVKRPDLLVFSSADATVAHQIVAGIGGPERLPFTREDDPRMLRLLDLALVAIECENSLWRARMMPAFGQGLRPQKRLGGRLGLAKNAVLPTVIVKDEDLPRLLNWETAARVPIHIWHSFFDLSFGISLADVARGISDGDIEPSEQIFQAPNGATSTKTLFKVRYHRVSARNSGRGTIASGRQHHG